MVSIQYFKFFIDDGKYKVWHKLVVQLCGPILLLRNKTSDRSGTLIFVQMQHTYVTSTLMDRFSKLSQRIHLGSHFKDNFMLNKYS